MSALAYLRFAPDAGPLSVPSGAHAGQLTLKSCSYDTERGSYPADCGTLVVPENRAKADSRLIALPVTRIRARSAHPGTAIFRLEGGPGITNMQFSKASRFADDHDVVLVGYRGVDGSSRLDCPEVESALKRSADFLGAKSTHSYTEAFRSCAHRLQADGVDLGGYTLPQRVDDLEAARRALGYHRIDLVSESVGTRTAMIYSWRHPKSIQRSVMIGVNPPGHFVYDPKVTDAQIRHYSDLCAKDASLQQADGRSGRIDGAHRRGHPGPLDVPADQAGERAARVLLRFDGNDVRRGADLVADDDRLVALGRKGRRERVLVHVPDGGHRLPRVVRVGRAGRHGHPGCSGRRGLLLGRRRPRLDPRQPGTDFIWAKGGLAGAWPRNPGDSRYSRVRTSNVETLLIGGTLDFATPLDGATKELLPHLPNGRQVVLPGFGHATDFWTYQPKASSHLVNTFLDSGRVDDSLYTPRTMDFEPGMTQTAIAKIVAGAMVGFALLALSRCC